MRCPECGQRLADGAKRCPACGIAIDPSAAYAGEEENLHEAYSGRESEAGRDSGTYYDRYSGRSPEDDPWANSRNAYESYEDPAQNMPMKWYKFLIYFSLILTAVVNIASGIVLLVGLGLGDPSTVSEAYIASPGLKQVDMIYGVISILFGLYAFRVRQDLRHYKRKAPIELMSLYALSAASQTIYVIMEIAVTGVVSFPSSVIATLLVAVIMIVANKIYFNKRMHLFTND